MMSISFVSITRSIIRLIEAFRIINWQQKHRFHMEQTAMRQIPGTKVFSITSIEEVEESYSLKYKKKNDLNLWNVFKFFF